MSKSIFFSLLFLLIAATAIGQKKSIVLLIKSQSTNGIKMNGKDVLKVYQGTFKQDYSTLSSDSAYFYPQDNAFDAFGHVVINQGDTLNIYSDKLNYNGNTKIAILTDHVKLVDKDATLTTDHLTYNTATRIGTYTDGGKLVNKDNTLLSKNGYYFAFSRDSYFRYNVSLKTPDALVITDTMRYNTGTKISYFYGPTNIYSTKNEKDKDTLYTENGQYDTKTEQAAFGKHNLYHSGTKSLKGDSLFYDKTNGYGRAVKHVTFEDKEQKVTIKGDLGTYFKKDEHTIVTQDPYVIMVSEEKDSTKTDSAMRADSLARVDSIAKADSVKKGSAPKGKGKINMAQLIKKTIPSAQGPTKTSAPPHTQPVIDSLTKVVQENVRQAPPDSLTKLLQGKVTKGKIDSAARFVQSKVPKRGTDSVIKQAQAKLKTVKGGQSKKIADSLKKGLTDHGLKDTTASVKDTSKIKRDSIYMSADTIETRILTYKDLKQYFEEQRLAHTRDTSAKSKKATKESKYLTAVHLKIPSDTSFRHRDYFGKPTPPKKKAVKPLSKKQLLADSLAKQHVADSIATAKALEPADTARIRIIIAHHHFKMFKSDLQAKADSMFYASSDSTIRCFVNPMMWAEGSQMSGDTIYLQMKHKHLDNMRMFPNAFIANIEKTDSAHFNQIAGKRMRGYFKNDKLRRMYVEGNAESIYFARDSGKMTIAGIQRSLSSRIMVDFKDNKVTNMGFYTKPENRYAPPDKFKEDDRILKGFIWKPKDRPVSKESIIPSYNKKKTAETKGTAGKKASGKKTTGKKTGRKQKAGKKPADDKGKTTQSTTPPAGPLKTVRDSATKTPKDTTAKADTTKAVIKKPVQ